MNHRKDLCAYTAFCQEDAEWIPQYLAEVERLELPFAVHFDRVRNPTKKLLMDSPYFEGAIYQNDPTIEFTEQHKQGVLDLVQSFGYRWAMAWDIDETFETTARSKFKQIVRLEADYVDTLWYNLWEDSEHIRVDGPFGTGHRVKFYNLNSGRWIFDHPITNGCKLSKNGKTFCKNAVLARSDLVCLHWGLMTTQLRQLHKERWDRIYGAAVGANPYGIWNMALDEATYPPVVIKHGYLTHVDRD